MANLLADTLRAATQARTEAPFAHMPDGTVISYGSFFAGAEKTAAALVSSGVAPGDRVAAQVHKSLQALQLYVGTIIAGGVFLPLNTGYKATELDHFVSDAAPTVFVCDPESEDAIRALSGAVVLTLDGAGGGTLPEVLAAQAAGFDPVPRVADDLAAILYTSGTTGKPKGAMLSHQNLASNARTLSEHWQFSPEDVLIHALPIFHTHGLFVATNITLVTGSSIIFQPGFSASDILAAMPDATVLMGVPTFYTRLLQMEGLSEAAKGMRLFVSGSAPLLEETHNAWDQMTGHRILERYGMTETNMNTSNPYQGDRRAGTVGLPLSGVDLRLTDGKGTAVPVGEPGIVEVRGPNVFKGYWNLPDKTAEELLPDGFFVTGDIGTIEDGYLKIIGRAKDLVISGGYNVYPKEIELLIDDQPGVMESAVIGVPHPDFGEGVVAVVVLDKPEATTQDAILAAIAPDLARYKQPKHVFVVEALPRNAMGKVQKNILRENYGDTFHAGQ